MHDVLVFSPNALYSSTIALQPDYSSLPAAGIDPAVAARHPVKYAILAFVYSRLT
jgi:hypothetical protein